MSVAERRTPSVRQAGGPSLRDGQIAPAEQITQITLYGYMLLHPHLIQYWRKLGGIVPSARRKVSENESEPTLL